MTHLRILFETSLNQRSALFCADGENNFLTLLAHDHQPLGSFVTRDFLFGIGYANSLLMEGLSLFEITEYAKDLKRIKGVEPLIEAGPDAARLRFCLKDQLVFEKVFADLLHGEMMAESYLDALQGWKPTRKKKPVVRDGLQPLLVRGNETHRGQISRICYGGSGSGVLLRIWEGDRLILESLGLFGQAVIRGNTLIPLDPPRGVIKLSEPGLALFGAPLILQEAEAPDDEDEVPSQIFYNLQNVETRVVPLPDASSPGFGVSVRIDGRRVALLVRDHDEGGLVFTMPQAIKRAQALLSQLQGWSLAPGGNLLNSQT